MFALSLGEKLNRNFDFDFGLFEKLCIPQKAREPKRLHWGGGEPTLYPRIIEAIAGMMVQSMYVCRCGQACSVYLFTSTAYLTPPHCFRQDGVDV